MAENPADTGSCILAIDPGREKLGLAVLDTSGRVMEKSVISRTHFSNAIAGLIEMHKPSMFAVGDGTGSEWVYEVLSSLDKGQVELVPERGTTLEAREMAWRANPPGGFWKILPKLFWPTPEDIDAWAAVVIGMRALKN